MSQPVDFAEVLDAVERLDAESQAQLAALLARRLAERGRQAVADSVAEARQEFAAHQCRPATAAELLREARS